MSVIFSFSLRSGKRFKKGAGNRGPGAGALAALAIVLAEVASAAVVDRIAVIVGPKVFTESEVLDELRLTEFLNQQPLDLSAAKRREAADRMVDQQLIRNEMETAHYPAPKPAEADTMLANFRREHFANSAQYRASLARYDVTEAQVKDRLLWQLAVIQFTDARFRPELPIPPAVNVQTADRLREEAAPAAPADGQSVDRLLDQWLKQARGSTRVVFKQEAFQ